MVWQFKDGIDFENWKVTNDSDHNQGQSFSSFENSAAGHGLFSGNVQAKIPLDGRIKRAGYCNIQSLRARVTLSSILNCNSMNNPFCCCYRNPSNETLTWIGHHTIC